jgi:hypothetical protein
MAQPRGALPHDDHFHIRVACPAFMEACVEFPTRNIARARLPHVRSRGTIALPPPSVHATAPAGKAPTVVPTPRPNESSPPRSSKPGSDLEMFGLGGSETPSPADVPPPLPAADPPAALDVPIDDVDGLLE